MTKLNLKSLKEKAQAATPGPWKSVEGNEDIGFTMQIMSKLWDVEGPKAVSFYTSNTGGKWDSEFIASANPATVLTLLDVIEKMRNKITELSSWNGYGECVGEDMVDELTKLLKELSEVIE